MPEFENMAYGIIIALLLAVFVIAMERADIRAAMAPAPAPVSYCRNDRNGPEFVPCAWANRERRT